MFHHRCSLAMVVLSAVVSLALQRTGWLDRVVQFQKEKFLNQLADLAPIKITAKILPKPEGYVDSTHWDYDSVVRLLTLIRESEAAKPVHKALRRMLRPTRRLMMSIKESKIRFPSINKEHNDLYYDGYDSSKENMLPAPPPVPEDQVVLVVSNPVEARLPSARISVKLLREILEARARAAREMHTTAKSEPWIEFLKNRTATDVPTTDATLDGKGPAEEVVFHTSFPSSDEDYDDDKTTAAGGTEGAGGATTAAGGAGDDATGAGGDAAATTAAPEGEPGEPEAPAEPER
ncbi:hypothetical protein PYW07_011253 [Mythimna separata]|uniref:Uncharacterized protein n=1 Tax=Mythimna separata TaxID=271217 RepID=A0AAD7Y909_MYTSE|nr:hypothetical protein PYW07_011253 [Mythimna separata]